MAFEKAFIPYGCYWSTPFCRWQGSFANLHPIKFAADVAARALRERNVPLEALETLVVGWTVPQKSIFYGAPWLAGLLGAPGITGPMIGQACATGAKCVQTAAAEIECGASKLALTVTTDRCSNGPHLYFPNPTGPGGTGEHEDWVFDNFGHDPFAKNAMIETAENCAREHKVSKEEQDRMALLREKQYADALADDRAFHKRYMVLPVEVKDPSGKKVLATVNGDEGPRKSTPEGLAGLKPVLPNGTVSFGTQTFPADGNSGIVVTTRDRARELSRDRKIEVQILSYGQGRVRKGFMAEAIIPAAKQALERAGISIKDVKVIKTHNPFAVNDVLFCREFDVQPEAMNNYGSSLVYGHPQGPTGMRLIIETIEELALKGGGYGLFDGCAAGDTGAAVVLKVTC
jgi:acetyl-CoA acetyltransferase family protein